MRKIAKRRSEARLGLFIEKDQGGLRWSLGICGAPSKLARDDVGQTRIRELMSRGAWIDTLMRWGQRCPAEDGVSW